MPRKQSVKIILASASPRRRQLLKELGLKFKVISTNKEEKVDDTFFPVQIARKLAVRKALEVSKKVRDSSIIIIAGDTIVVLGNKILGKPQSKKEAIEMLSRLSGKIHKVITGICILQGNKKVVGHEITKVTFQKLSPAMILSYVNTGESMDKAGGYGIQGKAALLIKKIEGDYFNVMGLPLVRLAKLLGLFGIPLL